MARHLRRLTCWILGSFAALVLLALLAVAGLWWFLDPDDYRAQIQARASSAIGRPVHLTGALRWKLGRRISLVSEGGDIANAAGFDAEPLARWSKITLGLAARPLLHKRVLIDRIDVEGLQLRLQRNAAGSANWELAVEDGGQDAAKQPVVLRIAEVAVRQGALRFEDAMTQASWRVTAADAYARLPEDLGAPDRTLRDVAVSGRLAGGMLAAEGVTFSLQAPALQWSPQRLDVPDFTLRWADAEVKGGIATPLPVLDVTARLDAQAPSLRAGLATIGMATPPLRDPSTLGPMQMRTSLRYTAGALQLDALSFRLDDTQVQGQVSLPKLAPLALRFSLTADRIDLDRYREPADVKSKPLELPLAFLKQLDARGTLRIRQATVAGAAAREVIIDVD
jgi:AsmA protein